MVQNHFTPLESAFRDNSSNLTSVSPYIVDHFSGGVSIVMCFCPMPSMPLVIRSHFISVWHKPCFWRKPCFWQPLPKRGHFDENGKNDENGGCHSGKGMERKAGFVLP